MKTISGLFALAFVLLVPALHGAEPPPAAPPSEPDVDLAALERFLDLPDEQLEQMQRAIAHIRALTPAQKAALRQEVEKFRRLPTDERRQLRHGWGRQEQRVQDAWRRMMQSAPPEHRQEIQRQLQGLSPEQKAEFRRQKAEEFLREEAAKKP